MYAIGRRCFLGLMSGLVLLHPGEALADDGSTVDRIRERGEITVGVRRDAKPHSYLDEAGHAAGYTVEVCSEMIGRLRGQLGLAELLISFEPVDATNRFEAVAQGRIDLLCGASTITLSRREVVDFSIPTFADGASVLTRKDASPDFAALAGKRIGVRAGTTTEEALHASLESFGIEAEIRPVSDHADGLRAVESGTIDAYFGDQSILYALLASSPEKDRLVVAGNTLTLELHGLALPLGDHRFRLEVDRALSRMYREGRMAAIFTAAFPDAEPGDRIRYIHTFAPIPP